MAPAATLTAPAAWADLSARLRDDLPGPAFLSLFATAIPVSVDETGTLTVALANEFCVSRSRPHHAAVDEWAAAAGLVGVEFVARDAIGLLSSEPAERTDPLVEARTAHAQHERDLRHQRAIERQREQPPGVITRLLAERGFWSLDPAAQLTLFEVDDLQGGLQVLPGPYGTPGTYEATVFAGLLTLWADGDRSQPRAESSLRNLADLLSLSWGGRTGHELVRAIDTLTTTSYRVLVEDDRRGWSNLFHLLDQAETRWEGPRNSPHSRIRAKFSDPVWDAITQPRVLRPIDLNVLHALGEQRQLAKRLFLYVEGIPMHRLQGGHEMVERIVDDRLAATLGAKRDLYELRRNLSRAGKAITHAAPRYKAVEIIPRSKRGLRRTDPRYLLRVVRSQQLPAP